MGYLSKYFKSIVIILGLIAISEVSLIVSKHNERAAPQKVIDRITNINDRAQVLCKFIGPTQCEPLREITTNARTAIRAANGDNEMLVAISKQIDNAELSLREWEQIARIIKKAIDQSS